MPYFLDEIDSASIYWREANNPFGHIGIVVHNASGSYLVHNMPQSGAVATPTSNMSKNWKKITDIPIKSGKNINGMFKSTGLACYLPNGLLKYISQGLCTGTTARMGEYLITY